MSVMRKDRICRTETHSIDCFDDADDDDSNSKYTCSDGSYFETIDNHPFESSVKKVG